MHICSSMITIFGNQVSVRDILHWIMRDCVARNHTCRKQHPTDLNHGGIHKRYTPQTSTSLPQLTVSLASHTLPHLLSQLSHCRQSPSVTPQVPQAATLFIPLPQANLGTFPKCHIYCGIYVFLKNTLTCKTVLPF